MANIKDIMTGTLEVILPDHMLNEVSQKMKDEDVGALPIVEDSNVVGIVTDRDIVVRGIAEGKDPNTTKVIDVMTSNVISIYDDQDVSDAVKMMKENQVRRLLVLDRNDKPTGFISQADIALKCKDKELAGEVLQEVSKPS